MKTIQEQMEDFRDAVATPAAHVPMTGRLITELSKSIDLDKPNAEGDPDQRCVAINRTLGMIGNRNRVVLVGRSVADLLATQLPAIAKATPSPAPVEPKSKTEAAKK